MSKHLGPILRIKIALFAVCLALAGTLPSYAQSAPTGITGVWTAGPDSAGANTYLGRLDAPRPGARIQSDAGLLVSGWAADTTAQGWAGFDQMQVYNGDRTKGGTKLADGKTGLSRPDVGDALGGNFNNSGFAATIPAKTLSPGPVSLYVYLHTPNKGWWYKNVSATVPQPVTLKYPEDPVVVWTRPSLGNTITNEQFGATAEYVLAGYAFDRNDSPDPNAPPKGPGNVGVSTVTLYMDKMPGDKGYDPNVNLLSGNSGGPASAPVTIVNPSNVVSGPNAPPCQFKGSSKDCQRDNSITNAYGSQYSNSGWVAFWNTRTVQPDMFHTLYAVARSSITGKTSTAPVQVYVKTYSPDSPPCATVQSVRKQCAYRAP